MANSKVKPPIEIAPEFVRTININGLDARYITLPNQSDSDRIFLVVPGLHSCAEKYWGYLEYLREFGEVNYIDLPGFGGMNSFHSIGQPVNIASYSDYLFSIFKILKLKSNVELISFDVSLIYIISLLNKYSIADQWIKSLIAFDFSDVFSANRLSTKDKKSDWCRDI